MAFQDFLIGLLLLLIGAVFCFAGYRFFRILIAIWGFLAGFELGAAGMTSLFGQNFLGTTTGWVLGFVIGIVIALLAYFFYYIAVVLLGASIGYSIGTGIMAAIGFNNPGFVSVIIGVVVAVVLALLILLFNLPKLLIMLFTAIGGAEAIISGVLVLFGRIHVTNLQYGIAVADIKASWFWGIAWIVLAALGFVVQWQSMRAYTMAWSETTPAQVR